MEHNMENEKWKLGQWGIIGVIGVILGLYLYQSVALVQVPAMLAIQQHE